LDELHFKEPLPGLRVAIETPTVVFVTTFTRSPLQSHVVTSETLLQVRFQDHIIFDFAQSQFSARSPYNPQTPEMAQ
jgi:hypothetical protein